MKQSSFAFLTSNRFWALIVGTVSIYLQAKGIIGEAEMKFIASLCTVFITLRTIDRVSDKKVVAALGEQGQ